MCDLRQPLPVPPGRIGLRQSDAVFSHIKQLPGLAGRLAAALSGHRVVAVTVSVRPRPDADSYLPVFRVGHAAAELARATADATLIASSHQEGHLACSDGFSPGAACLAAHLSGGTTDILAVGWDGDRILDRRLGGSTDLHAGQFVDKVGHALGLPFPAGPALDRLAQQDPDVDVPSAVSSGAISFSGPYSAALRLIDAGAPGPAVASAVLRCIARSVARAVGHAVNETGLDTLHVVGGVAASVVLRETITSRLARRVPGLTVRFAPAALCTDNAVGVARIGCNSIRFQH